MKTFIGLCIIAFISSMIFIQACTSTPITVEIIGPPIDTTGVGDTLILVMEKDPCMNDIISFERQILPLVVSGCSYSGCHDSQTAEDDVILESYNQIKHYVSAGNPNNSELYEVITENPNDDDFMPPKPAIAFTSDQINLIKTWIEQGAENTKCETLCDSDKRSFEADVYPIIANQCLGCHQPTNNLGSINLIDFDHVRTFAITGQLIGSIKHTGGYTPMPETALKMTECEIATIHNWIVDGAQNN